MPTSTSLPFLELKGVSHAFGNAPVLDALSCSVSEGEFVSILGPSGCGKTTLLRIIAGLLAPDAGEVLIGGKPAASALVRMEIGFVFQQPALLPWRTARANVALPLELARKKDPHEIADALLARVHLSEHAQKFPHELSGGQAQRVAVARAFANAPQLLLLDEPFSALDEITRNALHEELLAVRETERPATTLFVTHSIPEAVFLSDRVIVLSPRPGKIVDDVTIAIPRAERTDAMRYSDQFTQYLRCIQDSLRAA